MTITVTSDAVEITRLITSVVSNLVWPVAIVAIAWMLRPHFSEIIGRATSLEWGNLKIPFERKLETAEQKAGQIAVEPAEEAEQATSPPTSDLPPDYLVIEAWQRVEAELIQLAERTGTTLSRGRSSLYLTRVLRRRGTLDSETAALLDDLRTMRNVAVHPDGRAPIGYDQAVRYRDLADLLVARLRQLTPMGI